MQESGLNPSLLPLKPAMSSALTQEGEGGKPGHSLPAAFGSEASEGCISFFFFIILFYIRNLNKISLALAAASVSGLC